MKKNIFTFSICIILFATSGCATNSKTRYALMGGAASAGAAVGYATTKEGDSKPAHSALWAASFGLIAAVVGNYFFNDDEELTTLRKENELLKTPRLELIDEKTGYYTSPSLKNGKKQKYKVRIYKTNKWIDTDENTKYHQDMKLEKIPLTGEKKE